MYKIIAPYRTAHKPSPSSGYQCILATDFKTLSEMNKDPLVDQYGNKVAYLVDAQQALDKSEINVQIPPFCATSHEVMLRELIGIEELWEERESNPETQQVINTLIKRTLSPESDFINTLLRDLQHQFKPGTLLMIRSSSNEDGGKSSNAGGNDSDNRVGLNSRDLSSAYIRVILSYFADRSLKSRKLGAESPFETIPKLSVLIQEMIHGDTSDQPAVAGGVLVTREPCGQVDRVMQLEGVFGHCEGLVSSTLNKHIPRDTYIIGDGWSSSHIVKKHSKVAVDETRQTRIYTINERDQEKPAFSGDDMSEFFELGTLLKDKHGKDMDLEVVKDLRTGQLYLVQQRPLVLPKKRTPQYVSGDSLREDIVSRCQVLSSNLQVAVLDKSSDYLIAEDPAEALDFIQSEPDRNSQFSLPKVVKCRQNSAALSHEMMILRSLGITVIYNDHDRIHELLATKQTVILDPAQGLIIEASPSDITIKKGRINHPLKLWPHEVHCTHEKDWPPVTEFNPTLPKTLSLLRRACIDQDRTAFDKQLNDLYGRVISCNQRLNPDFPESNHCLSNAVRLLSCLMKVCNEKRSHEHVDREGEMLFLINQLEGLLFGSTKDTTQKSVADYLRHWAQFDTYQKTYTDMNPRALKTAVDCQIFIQDAEPKMPLAITIAQSMITKRVNERTLVALLRSMKEAGKLRSFLHKHQNETDYSVFRSAAQEYVDSFQTTLESTRDLRSRLTEAKQGSSGLLLAKRKTSCQGIMANTAQIVAFAETAADMLASTKASAKDLVIKQYIEMIHDMDRTIKLSTTANQEMEIAERVHLRQMLLEQFLELFKFCRLFITDILQDLSQTPTTAAHREHEQFQLMLQGVDYHITQYTRYLAAEWPKEIATLRPSRGFSVQHWQVGNAFWQNRNYTKLSDVTFNTERERWVIEGFPLQEPQNLEDVFTGLHQSMLAVAGKVLTYHSTELIERTPNFATLYQVVTKEIFPTRPLSGSEDDDPSPSMSISDKELRETEHGVFMACNIPLRTHSAELTVDYHDHEHYAIVDFNFTGDNEQNRIEAMKITLIYLQAAGIISDVNFKETGKGRSLENHMVFKINLPEAPPPKAMADLVMIIRALCLISFTFTSDIPDGFLDQCFTRSEDLDIDAQLEILTALKELRELQDVVEIMPVLLKIQPSDITEFYWQVLPQMKHFPHSVQVMILSLMKKTAHDTLATKITHTWLHVAACNLLREPNTLTPSGTSMFELNWNAIRSGLDWDQLTKEDCEMIIKQMLENLFQLLQKATSHADLTFHAKFLEFIAIMEEFKETDSVIYDSLLRQAWLLFHVDLYHLDRKPNLTQTETRLRNRLYFMLQTHLFCDLESPPIALTTTPIDELAEDDKLRQTDLSYFSYTIQRARNAARIRELVQDIIV